MNFKEDNIKEKKLVIKMKRKRGEICLIKVEAKSYIILSYARVWLMIAVDLKRKLLKFINQINKTYQDTIKILSINFH